MTRYLLAISLVLSACSSAAPADDDCMSVWTLFSEREDDLRSSCTRQRLFDFDDVGCMNGTNPGPADLAVCRPLVMMAATCAELTDAIRTCEGGTSGALDCPDVADAYDRARTRLRCPYTWAACPADAACAADFGAAASCAELETVAARCS